MGLEEGPGGDLVNKEGSQGGVKEGSATTHK